MTLHPSTAAFIAAFTPGEPLDEAAFAALVTADTCGAMTDEGDACCGLTTGHGPTIAPIHQDGTVRWMLDEEPSAREQASCDAQDARDAAAR